LKNFDTKDIKDPKELARIKEAKRMVALKKKTQPKELTTQQQKNIDNFYKMTGIERKE
jgi:hypothetical protein